MAINEGNSDGQSSEEAIELRELECEQALDAKGLLKNSKIVLVDPMRLNRLEGLGYLEKSGTPGIWYIRL
ncbi:MAG: hypothetical protein AAB383_06350 [Patescibacteria group bacterium]